LIIPLLLGAADLGLSAIEGGVKVYNRAKLLWLMVRPPEEKPVPGALSYRDVEHQREQMRSATSFKVKPTESGR
jgi:hypothetical protein